MSDFLTTSEIAAMLRCSPTHAAHLLKAKKIRGENLGGGLGWRAHRDDVEAFIRGKRAAIDARPVQPRAAR